MTQTSPQVLQTYALLQIAAESFLGRDREEPAAPVGVPVPVRLDFQMLKDGNGHSSRMTDQQAKDFAADWDVVAHQPNTATGFSATLFKLKPGRADPAKGTYEGQLVVSFRSTEFIEDAARDNQATNVLEVRQGGWAFGQIADMQTWWASVQTLVGGAKVDVTGYSLGGHLATAFNDLHGSQINSTYTFNGAGVGRVNADTNLGAVIAKFAERRDGGNADAFTASDALAAYTGLVGRNASGSRVTAPRCANVSAGVRHDA